MTETDLMELAERVRALGKSDNAVDVLVEVALFKPDDGYSAVRPNAAGTKVIYTGVDGREHTHWAQDWTISAAERAVTANHLRARAALSRLSPPNEVKHG